MEVPEKNSNFHIEDHHSPPSLNESEEDYLRTTWGKLGVGQDGYLDQSQLALVCECIGMEKLSDEVIAQLFDKLDLDHDGRISFGEFLHLFQNVRPGKGDGPLESENYEPNNWEIGSTNRNNGSLVRSELLMMPSQSTMALFSNIDPAGTGFATYDATVECLRSLGVVHASSLLDALSFRHHPSKRLCLRELVCALQEEMNAGLENGLLANSGPSGAALHAGVLLIQHELSAVRLTVEHASRECEKLRSDLQEANQRSSLLAQEVDENHAKQETIRRTQFKQLEQRHADQLRLVQEVAQADRDQLVSQLQRELDKRQQQLSQSKEEEARLKESMQTMSEDNARLSAENANLTEKLASSERANGRLIQELDGVSLMAELESRCEALEESQRHSLTEQLNRMSAENLQLRDRTDELSAEIELLRGQLAAARTECVGLGPAWRSEPTMSGAVKRRNGEEEELGMEDHVGKVRKKEAGTGHCSSEESPRPLSDNQNGWKEGANNVNNDQSLAAQLQEVKHQTSSGPVVNAGGSTIKEQLKRVFEKLRLQIVEEFLEGNDSVATLQNQYRNVLVQQEERHAEEKRSLIESHLLKLSALEAQLAETQIRNEDLVQLQTVMEAEHEMELKEVRQQLKRVHSKDSKQEEYPELTPLFQLLRENLTEALADLDAALEKELSRDSEHDSALQSEESSTKVEELEKQCKTLENELDSVKVEIVKILIDNEELRLKVRRQQEEMEKELKESEERMEEKVEFETALLQQRIKQLVRDLEDEKQRNQVEKNALEEDRRDLESRLDMLRTEFDRLDDYWQSKLDEEREIYDQERDSTDEKFRSLEMKIKEYEELLGQGDTSSTSSLSTIEERANWEKQLNDLEEESEAQIKQIAQLEAQLEQMQKEKDLETIRSRQEIDQLTADLQSTKLQLAEAIEREEKLIIKLENVRELLPASKSPPSPHSNRPLSPTPKPGILPPGYSPLKSKGWAKSQRSPASLSPCKSFESTIDGVDGRQLRRSPSLNSGTSEPHRASRVDISVFQSLNCRLKQQEQRCRELYYALQCQKLRTEQILFDTKAQHHAEITTLETMMKTSEDALRQMSLQHKQTMDKLASSDMLIMELYTENSQLLQALHLQNLSHSTASGLSM
ncbi:ninein-like isoform X2 [Daphnia carinata]|uniref:ninein-like isoform X2 n=1 Tax=Daphnia carinata TaxID=120202 RepID=UPI00257CA199|nr:ninein-like isoform X2 [Daphnia carinata]